MDHVREALIKAKASAEAGAATIQRAAAAPLGIALGSPAAPGLTIEAPVRSWTPRQVQLDPRVMKRNRIVAFDMSDPSHVAFDLLRTRVRKVLSDRGWKTVAVTSPTPGCGKTMVGLNLAFSLARVPDCRVVLVDLDLKRPSIARTLGVVPSGSIGQFLQGRADAKDCFVQIGPNLVIGLSNDNIRSSSELIQAPPMGELLKFIQTSFAPDIILFDLPPMQSSDDAIAFMPSADGVLLVAAAGTTTISEVDQCEELISRGDKLLGVVMNKSGSREKVEYY